jgi:3-deoxy-manno-octulosonate cytidylyltransferase (CMP-KDO synthetase)
MEAIMRAVAIIPARLGSSRFPGKPLAPLLGCPMVEHIVRRAELCDSLDAVYVATCDDEIRHAVERFGGCVLMTSKSHERATDRVAEAAQSLDADVVVMVQGDEPMITPEMIAAAIAPMTTDSRVMCVNLVHRIASTAEINDRNTIKVVMGLNGDALYFTRSPIPATDFLSGDRPAFYKQVCVIAFRRDFLAELASLPQTPLERAESIDMLRALEHGRRVRLVETKVETHAVDTPADLRLVESRMELDPLLARYGDSNRGQPQRA